MFVLIDGAGRLRAFSPDSALGPEVGETAFVTDLPLGFDLDAPMNDWLWRDGAWQYDPLPLPAPAPRLEDRMAAVEAAQTEQGSAIDDLVQVLADMLGCGAESGLSVDLAEGQSDAQHATETSGSPAGISAMSEGGALL